MSNFKLSLPTDIPWERICVTEDMIDRVVCDDRLPAKWQTSMAVFKYRPEPENQQYPKYTITYLKVTATITGYQPLDKEIQGNIDWDSIDITTLPGLTDLLNSYNPCHGAILQVVVGPHGNVQPLRAEEYPFFLDFEPKKRELYELATDTKEKQSRSIESLNITKSAGTAQSLEVLDVDMGGGGFGAQGSYAGTGGGFNYSAPNGQWGTKRLNNEEGMSSRSADVGQEKRDSYSFSTQISQMYHLLDSYHLGTNRAVFFVQPRPHTLEEPSGFVRGPRPVDGIQEFFLVVAQPREQADFCVSLRLDTSHITKTPILEYDRKSETTSIASANAAVATDHDIPAEHIVGTRACAPWPFDSECWDVHYQCYRTQAQDSVTYNAPAGYRIESYNDLINEADHGSVNVITTPNGASLSINADASGHICYETGEDVCFNCDDTIQRWAGHARRQLQVNLVSLTPTVQVGEEEVLLITTRGLCCCASEHGTKPMDEMVVGVKAIPGLYSAYAQDAVRARAAHAAHAVHANCASTDVAGAISVCPQCADAAAPRAGAAALAATAPGDVRYTIRQANELSNYIRTETLKSLNDPSVKLKKFIDTEFFVRQLADRLVQTRSGRELLLRSAPKGLSAQGLERISGQLRQDPDKLSHRDLLAMRSAQVARLTDMSEEQVHRLKLTLLGIKFRKDVRSDETPADVG